MTTLKAVIEKNKFAACIPLISETQEALLKEVEKIEKGPIDFLEWRRDYFRPGTALTMDEEIRILRELKKRCGNCGIIYTYRSHGEGGAYDTADKVRLKAISIAKDMVDYVDMELNSEPSFLKGVKAILNNSDCELILSHHNFEKTPCRKAIEEIYDAMENQGAAVLKLAVNPASQEDLRRLIGASLKKDENTLKPIIAIAMGPLGGITRIAPDLCGGSLTYVTGSGKTAPGQLTIEEILILRNSMGLEKLPEYR
ncbi:MAG: type I 3-dehydroquinate dehydratase [Eubacteriaceae bacterium]|nr:type I 3-dehydroquinate dehydratase [Eubacteriaceae bacterium]